MHYKYEILNQLETIENKVKNSKGIIFYAHSFTGNFQMKLELKNYFSNYDFYAINLPAHGNSPIISNEQIKISYSVKIMKKFIEENNLTEIIMIGHSMGGGIIAILNKLIPERIKCNIFEAPACGVMYLNNKVISKLIPDKLEDTKEIYSKLYYDPVKLFGNNLNKIIQNSYNTTKTIFSIYRPNFTKETLLKNSILYDEGFKSIKKPSLVILGENDGILPTNLMIEYFENINSKIKRVIVKKAAHAIFYEHKNKFIKIIDSYLQKLKK